MARYVTSVAAPLSAAEAFAFMADVTHFAESDPGMKRVLRVLHGPLGLFGALLRLAFHRSRIGDRAAAGSPHGVEPNPRPLEPR
jgi:hypothetical protein